MDATPITFFLNFFKMNYHLHLPFSVAVHNQLNTFRHKIGENQLPWFWDIMSSKTGGSDGE